MLLEKTHDWDIVRPHPGNVNNESLGEPQASQRDRNNSDGKASLKRQRPRETSTDTQKVRKFS